ncbi:MAG: hypothetical protein A2Y33_08265 [Spirochaetes bacterium GWF1_51_8]|nr:MAG: hypothetical protein A2Y33_08265 [Spirochaetes bacterium GWF1_51_8]
MQTEKLRTFIEQITNSPAIKNLPAHEKEESVLTFINQNEGKLSITFSSPDFYPEMMWPDVKAELVKTVGEVMTDVVRTEIKAVVDSLKLDWKGKYSDFLVSNELFAQQIADFAGKLSSRYASRIHYGYITHFIKNSVIPQFILAAYNNRRYVFNGLSKFDQIGFAKPEEAIDFINTALLFLPIYDITLPLNMVMPGAGGPANKTVAYPDTESNLAMRKSFLGKLKEIIVNAFPNISPYFLDIILRLYYFSEEAESVKFSSKVLKVFYNMALQWKKVKKDRGAESFEGSWFNVARANYKFYIYDLNTVDELYKITIEEGI